MSLTGKITLGVKATLTSPLDLSTPGDALDYSKVFDILDGTGVGSGNANMMWHDRRTLAGSATEDLDLAGVLANAFGASQTFVRVKALLVFALAANTNNVNILRPAANGVPLFLAAGDGIPVPPGGAFFWIAPAAGVTVTPATGDLVTLANSGAGTPVTYDVIVIGASA